MSEKELTKRKVLLAKIAGRIAGGINANPALVDMNDDKIRDYSVNLAKQIIEKVDELDEPDKPEPDPDNPLR